MTPDPSEPPRGDPEPLIPGMLQAVVAIGSQLELEEVLQRIVATAAHLGDAQYAALGILDVSDRRRLARFVTVGMDDETVAAIGAYPEGHGVLGVLIDEPRAIRLNDLAEHPASYGFPANHPPMRSFLGAPISVRGEAYGNLYLTEKRGGGAFTEADEQILLAIAAAAGLAVQNARLYEEGQRRQQWLVAAGEITTRLLAGGPTSEVFPLVVGRARELANGDLGFLALPRADGTMRVVAADGVHADRLDDLVIPSEALAVRVMHDGVATSVVDPANDPRVWRGLYDIVDLGPALYVPLETSGTTMGTLVVAGVSGRPPFSADALQLVESFAAQATLALRIGGAALDREQLAVLGDRDRIARDLHDLVIQRLFATGMGLESVVRQLDSPDLAARVGQAVDDLDVTIKEIRSTIFALQSPAPLAGEGLRAAVLHACALARPALGFDPRLRFAGAVDTVVPAPIGEQMVAVLREALSNVARHAQAAAVQVEITADVSHVSLTITDDGCGIAPGGRRSGLRNLETRANDLGGTFGARSPAAYGHGTVVSWAVPLE